MTGGEGGSDYFDKVWRSWVKTLIGPTYRISTSKNDWFDSFSKIFFDASPIIKVVFFFCFVCFCFFKP